MNALRVVILFLLALFQLSTTWAWAYIPPSPFILKSLVTKHYSLKGLRIRSVVTAVEGDKPSSVHFKTLTHYNPQTGVIHAYALDDSNQKLYGVERRAENTTAAEAVLFWSNSKNLALALKARGVQDESYLGHIGSTLAWVLGKKGSGSHLWVEKDTFLPVKFDLESNTSEPHTEVFFEAQHYYREFPYPKVISLSKGKTSVLKDEVQDVSFTFDANEFKAGIAPGFTEAGNLTANAVRELIRSYFESIR